MNGTYQNIDCMELMATLKDKEIDLAIVDPPYGLGNKLKPRGGMIGNTFNRSCEWDQAAPNKEYFNELFRISKNQIIWGGNYFIENLFSTQCFLIWDKMNGTNPMADCEQAWTSFKNKVSGMFRMHHFSTGYDSKIHPTQKPVKLYEWLLTNYAKPNDLILDTHCGSASSLIACENLGFKYIASELDKDYYYQSLQRIETHLAQGKLFQRVGGDKIESIQPAMFA